VRLWWHARVPVGERDYCYFTGGFCVKECGTWFIRKPMQNRRDCRGCCLNRIQRSVHFEVNGFFSSPFIIGERRDYSDYGSVGKRGRRPLRFASDGKPDSQPRKIRCYSGRRASDEAAEKSLSERPGMNRE
jgi:hypothetical protein